MNIRRTLKKKPYIYNSLLEFGSWSSRFSGKTRFHFLHIRKTGGTAIKHALKNHLKCDNSIIILHPHRIQLSNIPEGDKVFFFLRDPLKRFVSGFYSRKRQGQPRYNAPWSNNEKIAFTEFKTPNQLAESIYHQDDTQRERAQFAMRSIKHVNSFYRDWLGDESYLDRRAGDIIHVGFLESISTDLDCIKKLINLPGVVRLPDDNRNAHKNPSSSDNRLSDSAVLNLERWYHKDIHCITQCRNLMKGRNTC